MSDDAKLAKEGLAFVRREKQDDALITDRLKSVYGEKKRTHDTNRRGPKWVCAKCKYMNFESRRVCGECLAVQEDNSPAGKKKVSDGGSVPVLPAHTQAPDAKILVVGGRSYRVHAGHAFKKRSRVEGKSLCKKGDAMKGGDCSDDGSCSDDDGSSCDDEPACGAASAGSADGEVPDSDDDGSEPFYSSAGVSVLKDGSQYACNYFVPPAMFSHLIGPKGRTLRETHWKSGAEIELPPSGASPTATIEIRGRKRLCVRKAIQEIQAILAANTVPTTPGGDGGGGNITHFISVPLGRIPALKAAFSEVLDAIETEAKLKAESAAAVAASTAEGSSGAVSSSSAVDTDLFQIPNWVHYSIVMLCLPTEAALNKAREILKAIIPELSAKIYTSSATPKSVALKGVVSLSGSPSKAHVLYAQPDPSHPSTAPLIQMCEGIKAAFAAEGMVPKKDADMPLTLHATLLNATFRMAKSKQRRRQMFDGSWVVDKYGKFDFGVHDMPPFEINRKGEKTKDTTMDSFPVSLGAVSA